MKDNIAALITTRLTSRLPSDKVEVASSFLPQLRPSILLPQLVFSHFERKVLQIARWSYSPQFYHFPLTHLKWAKAATCTSRDARPGMVYRGTRAHPIPVLIQPLELTATS